MNDRIVKSFKAVIVLTRTDGYEPSLQDVELLLSKAGLAYGMPGQPDSPIVLSFNDSSIKLPPREKSDTCISGGFGEKDEAGQDREKENPGLSR